MEGGGGGGVKLMFVNAQLHKISRAEMKYPEADKATNIIRWVVQGVCG